MKQKDIDKLLSDLSKPIHYNYISKYLLEKSEDETLEILHSLIDEGLIEEYMFKGYYVTVK